MNADSFLNKRFDLKPVSESDLQALEGEFIKYKRDDAINFQCWIWVAIACFSVVVFFVEPLFIIASMVVGVVLIAGYFTDVGGAKANFGISSSPLTADDLPTQTLDLMRDDPGIKSDIVALMKQQGGLLFGYQVGGFWLKSIQNQRESVKQAISEMAS